MKLQRLRFEKEKRKLTSSPQGAHLIEMKAECSLRQELVKQGGSKIEKKVGCSSSAKVHEKQGRRRSPPLRRPSLPCLQKTEKLWPADRRRYHLGRRRRSYAARVRLYRLRLESSPTIGKT